MQQLCLEHKIKLRPIETHSKRFLISEYLKSHLSQCCFLFYRRHCSVVKNLLYFINCTKTLPFLCVSWWEVLLHRNPCFGFSLLFFCCVGCFLDKFVINLLLSQSHWVVQCIILRPSLFRSSSPDSSEDLLAFQNGSQILWKVKMISEIRYLWWICFITWQKYFLTN